MSSGSHDPEVLADFVAESTELLDQLEQDLIELELHPSDESLIQRVFRAMHTIKGSASFLAIPPVESMAHAAEDALNLVRNGAVALSPSLMDQVLKAADVLRRQIKAVAAGAVLHAPPQALIESLRSVACEQATPAASSAAGNAEPDPSLILNLPASKRDLLPFMVDDLQESLNHIAQAIDAVVQTTPPADWAAPEQTAELIRSVGFFAIEQLSAEVQLLHDAVDAMVSAPVEKRVALCQGATELIELLRERSAAARQLRQLPAGERSTVTQLRALLGGSALEAGPVATPAPAPTAAPAPTPAPTAEPGNQAPAPEATSASGEARTPSGESADQTIRISVDRLDALLNLVGELVLYKNRMLALAKRVRSVDHGRALQDEIGQMASDLDRVSDEIHLGVMRTRMQPLSKLFNRYPRLIRDLVRTCGKQVELEVVGGDVEVDKSVLEAMGDPLVHMLRNSVDHGVETPERRTAQGKTPVGRISLRAHHEGDHVLIQIVDDGAGIDAARLAQHAINKGLITREEVDAMSVSQQLNLIFLPGFSTAEQVTNLSGRGVGMDVVRTNIARINGTIVVDSTPGLGTTISISIPLTVAIVPAMMIAVGRSRYAVPLLKVEEIVRLADVQCTTVHGAGVIRVRDQVLATVDLEQRLGERETQPRFALVVRHEDRRVALLVDQPLGYQEVVIKPLGQSFAGCAAVNGATIREDGGVSLILDVATLVGQARVARAA